MEILPVSGKDILNRIGPIKNQLLSFVVVICLILKGSAYLESGARSPVQGFGDLLNRVSCEVLVFLAVGFYIYAYLNLPSSSQERIFANEARTIGKEHENRGRKAAKAVKKDG